MSNPQSKHKYHKTQHTKEQLQAVKTIPGNLEVQEHARKRSRHRPLGTINKDLQHGLPAPNRRAAGQHAPQENA